MRQINVYFEDTEYELLVEKKNGMTWHEFIMTIVKEEEIENGS